MNFSIKIYFVSSLLIGDFVFLENFIRWETKSDLSDINGCGS